MDAARVPQIALATVVTKRSLSEFLVMKRSYELIHRAQPPWFVCCDEAAHAALAALPNVRCRISAEERTAPDRPLSDGHWRTLMAEKMNVIEDAWSAGDWDAVAYLDSDLIVVAPFMDAALALGGQVVLSPHYRPEVAPGQPAPGDYYNGGFVLVRDRQFQRWWRVVAAAERSHLADQTCLIKARTAFDVKEMGEAANVGWWRSPTLWDPPGVPANCQWLHVHLFQDAHKSHELGQKHFALTCVAFLASSPVPAHRLIAEEIFALDTSGYYDTLLRRRVTVLTVSEPLRAVRLLLMARMLPSQVEIRCACRGGRDDLARRLADSPWPSHLKLVDTETIPRRRDWLTGRDDLGELVFPVDIDFIFPPGFWFKFCAAHHAAALEPAVSGTVTCPVPLRDPDGRFLWYQFWHRYHALPAAKVPLREGGHAYIRSAVRADLLASETPNTHYVPVTAEQLACAAPVFPTASRALQDVDAGVAACVEVNGAGPDGRLPWPGIFMRTKDFLDNRRHEKVRVATNAFIFHLWHPPDQESICAHWYSTDEGSQLR